MGVLDDLASEVAAARPKCKQCGAPSDAKITYAQDFGRRRLWFEEHTCLDHSVNAIDRLRQIGFITDVTWLDD